MKFIIKYIPDLLIISGVWFFSAQNYGADEVFGILLLTIGAIIIVRRYFNKK